MTYSWFCHSGDVLFWASFWENVFSTVPKQIQVLQEVYVEFFVSKRADVIRCSSFGHVSVLEMYSIQVVITIHSYCFVRYISWGPVCQNTEPYLDLSIGPWAYFCDTNTIKYSSRVVLFSTSIIFNSFFWAPCLLFSRSVFFDVPSFPLDCFAWRLPEDIHSTAGYIAQGIRAERPPAVQGIGIASLNLIVLLGLTTGGWFCFSKQEYFGHY